MCGRYVLKADAEEIEQAFEANAEQTPKDSEQKEATKNQIEKRYNIAPSSMIATVRQFDDKRLLANLKWGLVPAWAKDAEIGNRMINARAESLTEKPSFRNAFRSRRCLIPASGFYEWQHAATSKSGKQPFYFYLKNKPVFGFAGLWEEWTDKTTGEKLESCAIITTEANKVLAPVHNRMPVIIKQKDYQEWLDPKEMDTDRLQKLLIPYESEEMESHAVSRQVNSPTFDSPELINSL